MLVNNYWRSSTTYLFWFSAIIQDYVTNVGLEYVIIGNDVLMKCKIPSFVADIVVVVGWGFLNHEKASGKFEETLKEGKTYHITCTNRAFD